MEKSRSVKDMSLTKKLIAAMSCIAVLMAAYSVGVSFWLASSKLLEMNVRISENNADSAERLLSVYLDVFDNYSTQIIRIPELQEMSWNDSRLTGSEAADSYPPIDSSIRYYVNMAASDGINFGYLNIYLVNGFSYSLTDRYTYPYNSYGSCVGTFKALGLDDSDYTRAVWITNATLIGQNGSACAGLVNVRFLYNPVTMEKVGVMVAAIFEDNLCACYSGFASNAFIMDKNGVVLSSPDKQSIAQPYGDAEIRSRILDNAHGVTPISVKDRRQQTLLVSFRPVMGNDAYLVTPFDFYTELRKTEIKDYFRSAALPMLLGIAAVMFLAYLVSKQLAKSIVSLTAFVKRVYTGNFGGRFLPKGHDEVTYLGEKINHMLNRIQDSEQQRETELKAKQLLELQLLQSQINPHLLYNTLDSVLWALRQKRIGDAENVVTWLSEFFKRSLSQGRMETTLNEELILIRSYISIQQLARQKDYTVFFSVEPGLLSHPIVKLSLQPIVENAIIHGFSGYRDDGRIDITASHDGKLMTVTVTDNGIGILPDEVESLNNLLHTYPPPPELHSYGLYNVNRRIAQAYGELYGIAITSSVCDFTTVTLTMPYMGGTNNA